MCVGYQLAIRIEEKGEGFENGNCSLASWFTFNPNHLPPITNRTLVVLKFL